MSFILDALRKSESRRKAGEVPGLDTETGEASGRRRARLAPVLLVALPLTALLVAGGLYMTRPHWLPGPLAGDTDPQPAVAVVPDQMPEPAAAPEVDRESLARVQELVAAGVEDTLESEPEPVVDRRRLQPQAAEQRVARPAPEREHVVTDPDEAMAEIERRVAETMQRRERAESPEPPVDDEHAPEETEEAVVAAVDPAVEDPWRPQAAEYVRAWELPLSVRRSLPELKLTIHVFSPQEEGRFVLINGERYVPGDQLTGGARLVDIRREGAIVDFREHRFLLEP